MKIPDEQSVRPAKVVETWLSAKAQLMRTQPWLESYRDFSVPLDETLYQSIHSMQVNPPYPHEILLVEPLLADIAALLDRCSSYRQELYALEVSAVSSSLTHTLGLTTGNLDRELSRVRNRRAEADVLRRAQETAANEFGTASELSRGYRAEAIGEAAAYDLVSQREGQAGSLEDQRFEAISAFNELILKAIAAPGSGFNYAERYNQLKDLLIEDFQEAYRKAKCAEAGLVRMFHRDNRFQTFGDHRVPEPTPNAYFQRLVSWTRESMRRIERISEFETEYDLMVPLARALVKDESPLITRQEFNRSIRENGDGNLEFDLTSTFPHQSSVRLRGIGLSYVRNSEDDQFIKGNRRLRCVVFPPEQQLAGGANYRRPPVLLNNVGERLVEHAEVTIESGPNIYNIDPRGKWTLRIYSRAYSSAITADETELEERDDLVWRGDIVLHLRVRSVPNVEPSEWRIP